jgi:hypothetical protein
MIIILLTGVFGADQFIYANFWLWNYLDCFSLKLLYFLL